MIDIEYRKWERREGGWNWEHEEEKKQEEEKEEGEEK